MLLVVFLLHIYMQNVRFPVSSSFPETIIVHSACRKIVNNQLWLLQQSLSQYIPWLFQEVPDWWLCDGFVYRTSLSDSVFWTTWLRILIRWLIIYMHDNNKVVVVSIYVTIIWGDNYVTSEQMIGWIKQQHDEAVLDSKWAIVMEICKVLCIWSCKTCLLVLHSNMTWVFPLRRTGATRVGDKLRNLGHGKASTLSYWQPRKRKNMKRKKKACGHLCNKSERGCRSTIVWSW